MFNRQCTYNIIINIYKIPILPYIHPLEYITGKLLIYRVRIYSQKARSQLSRPQRIGLKPPPYCNTSNFLHTLPHLNAFPPGNGHSLTREWSLTHTSHGRRKLLQTETQIQLIFNKN